MAADVLHRPQSIEITAQAGLVSLTGCVPAWSERRRATAAARQEPGVIDVPADITVSDPSVGPPTR